MRRAESLPPEEVEGVLAEGSDYWTEHGRLIVRRHGSLPNRCLACNEPAVTRVGHSFSWHPRWLYLLLLAGLLPYLIIAIFAQREMRLALPICERHRRKYRQGRRLRRLGIVGLVVVPVSTLVLLDVPESGRPDHLLIAILLALGMFLVILVGERYSKIIEVKRITSDEGRFTASPAFLAASPDHPWGDGPVDDHGWPTT